MKTILAITALLACAATASATGRTLPSKKPGLSRAQKGVARKSRGEWLPLATHAESSRSRVIHVIDFVGDTAVGGHDETLRGDALRSYEENESGLTALKSHGYR